MTDSSPTPAAPQRIVVVGSGLGGLRVVERLRHRGFDGELVLLGAEHHLPYDRPPLSKQVLRGERDSTGFRAAEEFRTLGVTVRLDDPATSLDVDSHLVHTEGGTMPFDVCVVATGAMPRRLPGLNGLVLRTLDDSLALRASLSPDTRLGIVGAGLIGCEVAASARAMGVQVDLVDVLPAPAIRVLGPRVASVLADLHVQHGVALHTNTRAVRSEAGGLQLDDGRELAVDVVLEAVGAVPDVAWLANSGLRVSDGIECDANGVAAPDIYAVGDVAQWAGRRHEHWTNVGAQADRVAAVILAQPPPAEDIAYWWSDQYDIRLQGLGSPAPDDEVDIISWGAQSRTIALYSRAGRLTGAVGFSAAGGVMRLRADIAAMTDVAEVLARFAGG